MYLIFLNKVQKGALIDLHYVTASVHSLCTVFNIKHLEQGLSCSVLVELRFLPSVFFSTGNKDTVSEAGS